MEGNFVMKKVLFNQKRNFLFLAILLIIQPGFSANVGDQLEVLSRGYGFFSGDYYTWSTCRGVGENIEIFVENAVWDSSITDTSYNIPSNNLTVLEQDGDGGLFIGTQNGLAHFDGSVFTDYSTSLNDSVASLSFDGTSLWVGTIEGLYKFKDGIASLYYDEEVNIVKSINSNVWVGTPLGLIKVNVLDSTWTSYPAIDTINSPVSDVINDIEADDNGLVWLATDKGVCYQDSNEVWQIISSLHNLISDNVYDLTLDTQGFWVATDKGIAHFINDSTYSNYERKNSGLTLNSVKKVVLNNNVRWIASEDGFFRFEGEFDWYHFGADYTNYLQAHTTDTLNSLEVNDIAIISDDVYVATDWGLTRLSGEFWETWRGPHIDNSYSVDSAMVAAVIEAWENKTPGLDSSHYFYNSVADIYGVNPGGDTLGIYDEITAFFGDISDVDENGKVTVVLLDIQDYWDDVEDELDGLGNLTYDGFFLEQNLTSVEPTMRRDLLYIDARRQSQTEIEMALAHTLARHIVYNHDQNEELWQSVGFGMVAEILAGYTDQSIGFRGFTSFNYPCQNSILSWASANPYADMQFSELLLLYTAENYQSGLDGGLGILHDIANNTAAHGIDAFNAALQSYGTEDSFTDIFYNLGVTAIIEQQKSASMDDHSEYKFSYNEISSMTEYNTIYWGKNNQDSPPYLGVLPEWSSRVFNGRKTWNNALRDFRLVSFNGDDNNQFRVAIIFNPGSRPDTNTVVTELALDEQGEMIYPLLDTLDINSYSTYTIVYFSVYGSGDGVTQMAVSQDVVSPDDFGGISVGVVQNPLEEKMLDLYVSSFEPLYMDVGDGAFTDDGGQVLIISNNDTTTVPMEKVLTDESAYSFSYDYTYPYEIYGDSISTHDAEANSYHLYHAEYMMPSNGNYDLAVSGQDVSGNDVTPDTVSISVSSVNSAAKTIVSSDGDFSIEFDKGSVQGTHTLSLISTPQSQVNRAAKLNGDSDFGMINMRSDNTPLSDAYRVNPQDLELTKPVKIRISYDITSIKEEDLPFVNIYQYYDGQWTGLPTRLDPAGKFMEIEVNKLGVFQVQRGFSILDRPEVPHRFALHQNYPNPFNPTTMINFDLPERSMVTLKVFNVLGQEIAVLANGVEYKAGFHSIVWNGKNLNGKTVSSGTYIYAIKAGHNATSKKMVLIR